MNPNKEFPPGLEADAVLRSREIHGNNALSFRREWRVVRIVRALIGEPMILLLLATATIYFLMGEAEDGFFLLGAVLLVAGISIFQDVRSRMALEKLHEIGKPLCQVIRSGRVMDIPLEDVVVGDCLMAGEGATLAADGRIVRANDFSVDESLLTGESFPVSKSATSDEPMVFRGSVVISGLALVMVTAVGNQTRIGRIGKSLETLRRDPSPLQKQIRTFVRNMSIAGLLVFLLICAITYYHSGDPAGSLLSGLTLAMSILPEEIPVAFTTFMALGAWRLTRIGILVKDLKTVETLGSATVICSDKTGTITRNEMALAAMFSLKSGHTWESGNPFPASEFPLLRLAMWASEPIPFDPMEIALHKAYGQQRQGPDERPLYSMKHEYPLEGVPPMMTHIFENREGQRIIAAKGAPEAFMNLPHADPRECAILKKVLEQMGRKGYRVLGVAEASFPGPSFPEKQQDLPFSMVGLIAFFDPPKDHISEVFEAFSRAGIQTKIITGDNPLTTQTISSQIGFPSGSRAVEGSVLSTWTDEELARQVPDIRIFSRMYPEAKLRVINALKARGEIVAMTGDGINDGPALRSAHIGIAMGKRGTSLARDAAALVLMDDDLSSMVGAIGMGRRIYTNLKKAVQYIISIHIPIVLLVFLPVAFNWMYPQIFSPVHVIILELIMGPTCSIVYENEPMEPDTMSRKPRPVTLSIFNRHEIMTSVLQGLVITAATLGIYHFAISEGAGEDLTRTLVFTCLIAANMLLTLVNRSFISSIWSTMKYKNAMVPATLGITTLILALMLYVPGWTSFFEFETPPARLLLISFATGMLSALWYEGVKWYNRKQIGKNT